MGKDSFTFKKGFQQTIGLIIILFIASSVANAISVSATANYSGIEPLADTLPGFNIIVNNVTQIVAGEHFKIQVEALDELGSPDTDYAGTVSFSSTDTKTDGLPNDYTFQPEDLGLKSFDIILKMAGSQTITVTDGTMEKESSPLTVFAAKLDHITCSVSPTTVTAGAQTTGTAIGYDVYDNNLVVVSAVWSVESGAGGSWSSNVYTSHTSGIWTITAIYAEKSSTCQLTVNTASLASLSVSLSSSDIVAGDPVSGIAIGYDNQGNSLGPQTSFWSIQSGAGGSWIGNVYASKYSGGWTVTAAVGSIHGTAPLIVNNGPLASILVSLSSYSVTAGSTVTCTATGYDSQENNLGVQTASWSIESAAGGSWSNNIYTSKYAGTWEVSATVSAIKSTKLLEVNSGPLNRISVSLSDNTITAGGTITGTAVGYDNQGNNLGSQTAVWSINPEASGIWLNNVYTSKYAGSWTVTASVSGIQDTAALEVTAGPLYRLSISMSPSSIVAGATSTGTAIGYDDQGNNLDAQVSTWSIEGGAAGSWAQNLYTSQNAGTWQVFAKAENSDIQGTTTLTVNAADLYRLSVSLSSSTIVAGATTTGTAIGYDAKGNNLGPQSVTWSIQSGASGSWSTNIYTSKFAGTWTVKASVSGIEGTIALTVNTGPLDRITCSINPSTINLGEAVTGTATAWDSQGNSIGAVTGTWSIQNGAGGSWDSNIYISQNSGVWTVTAAYNGKTDTTTLTVNPAPTPTPTATPTPTPTASPTQPPTSTQTPSSTDTPTPTTSQTPIPTASPSIGPTSATVHVTTSTGQGVDLVISGNITASQITNLTINSVDTKTTVSFTLTGESGTTGFANFVIPKTAIPYGVEPTVLVSGEPAQNQGYTQDGQNFYVWFTTHFSTHQVEISFTSDKAGLEVYSLWIVLVLVVILIVISICLFIIKSRGQTNFKKANR